MRYELEIEQSKSLLYDSNDTKGMIKCALCGREISDPTECIVYENYKFDKVACLYIFKKLSFIYNTAIVDIVDS